MEVSAEPVGQRHREGNVDAPVRELGADLRVLEEDSSSSKTSSSLAKSRLLLIMENPVDRALAGSSSTIMPFRGRAVSDDVSEALRDSEQRYRTLFEQAPAGVFLYDEELVITDFNPRFVEILRSTPEQAARPGRCGAPRQQDPAHARADPARRDRSLRGRLRGDDERRAMITSVSPRGSAARRARSESSAAWGSSPTTATDRTRPTALRELRAAPRAPRAPQPARASSVRPARAHREWNPSAERIFGWTEEEAIGKSGLQLLAPRPGRARVLTDVFRAI